MTLAQQVGALEADRDALADLAGTVLATLQLNLLRGHLKVSAPEGLVRLDDLIHSWKTRLEALEKK